ncbi:ubiad1, partial [Symbiodinium pilosum]
MMVGRQHFVQNFSPMENRGCPSLMLLKFRKPMRVTCYSFVATVVQWCAQHSKIFAVENPHRSFFWLTSYWQSVAHLVTYVRFDHCAYGGQRQKTTAIAHNCTSVESLAKFCPGHICAEQHLPWGPSASAPNGYATSEETAYPPRLAAAIALAFLRGMAAKGWSGSQVSLGASEEKLAAAAERAIAGIQSKASRFPAPVSEHERVIVLRSRLPLALPCQPGERIEQPFDVPLHVTAQPTCRQVPAKSQLLRSVPITGAATVSLNKSMSLESLARMRTVWMAKWAKRAEELKGEVPAAGIFAPTFKPAKCTAESLKCNAVQLREDVLKK